MRFGAKRKMFSLGSEASVASAAEACRAPFPFVSVFCSAAGSGAALVGVSCAAAAAMAACRRVLAPDMIAVGGLKVRDQPWADCRSRCFGAQRQQLAVSRLLFRANES